MVRPVVDTSLPITPLQPVAQPVDTYVRPAVDQNAGSGLMDIAKALQNFSQPLNDLITQREQKAADDDKLRAQADHIKNNGAGYDEATKQGLIPAQASPSYVKAYKEAQGDVAGGNLAQEIISAYEQSDAKNSDDPNALNQFTADFLKNRIGTSDPDILRGLLPQVAAARTALQNRHIQDRDQAIRNGATSALGAQGAQAIDGANVQGLATGQPNYDSAFSTIEQKRQAFTGMSDQDADKAMFDTVTAKAIEHDDAGILDFFNRKVPGKDYTYKDTPEGQKYWQEATQKLDIISRQKKVEDHQAQTAADKVAKNKSEADALSIISANPNAPLPDNLNATGKVYNGAWDAQVQGWRTLFKNAQGASDPDALAHLNRSIADDPANGPQSVIDALKQGAISASDFQSTYRFAQELQKDPQTYGDIQKDARYVQTMGAIKDQLAPSDINFTARPDWTSRDAFRAQSDFQEKVLQWAQQNPQDAKDPIKRSNALKQMGADILSAITPGGKTKDGHYTAPDGGQGNPFGANPPPAPPAPTMHERTWSEYRSGAPTVPGVTSSRGYPMVLDAPATPAPQVPTQAPPAPPATAPATAAPGAASSPPQASPTPQEVDTWYRGLSPDRKSKLDTAAGASKNPEAYKQQFYQRYLDNQRNAAPPAPGAGTAPDGTPVTKSSFSPGQDALGTPETQAAQAYASPGEALDHALRDPQGAVGAIQQALSPGDGNFDTALQQQTQVDNAGSAFDEALKTNAASTPRGNGPVAQEIAKAAQELGTDPRQLAAVISYETKGTFDPNIIGGTGNRYKGLIQFGPEEQRKYGIRDGMTVAEQLPAVVRFLKDRGFKPGMGLLDLYSTVNAGSPGHYDASDGHGTVRSHVEEILAGGHANRAMAMFGNPTSATPAEVSTGTPPRAVPASFSYGADTPPDQQPKQAFIPGLQGNSATKNMKPFSAIVMHVTGKPTLQSEMDYMAKPDSNRGGAQYGYHFLIDKDGTVYQTAPLNVRTNHIMSNKERGVDNSNAIGISLVGGNLGATPQQIAAGEKLAKSLQKQFGIGDDRVVAHGEIQANRSRGLGPAGMDSEAADFMQAFRGQKVTPVVPYAGNPFGVGQEPDTSGRKRKKPTGEPPSA